MFTATHSQTEQYSDTELSNSTAWGMGAGHFKTSRLAYMHMEALVRATHGFFFGRAKGARWNKFSRIQGPAVRLEASGLSPSRFVLFIVRRPGISYMYIVSNLEGSKPHEAAEIQGGRNRASAQTRPKKRAVQDEDSFRAARKLPQFDPDRFEVDLHYKKLAVKSENKGHSR